MISNAVLFLIGGWVGTFGLTLFAFSDVTVNPSVTTGLSTAAGYLHLLYNIMPLTTIAILGCFIVFTVFEAFVAGYKLIKWGYSKIPGIT